MWNELIDTASLNSVSPTVTEVPLPVVAPVVAVGFELLVWLDPQAAAVSATTPRPKPKSSFLRPRVPVRMCSSPFQVS